MNIELRGIKEVEGMRFHDIEGGFGESKKAMLVKDIAEIHKRKLMHVNELINNNRKRFKDNIDIVDLKQIVQNDMFLKAEIFTKAQWGNAKNIYLLSERGYSKLLKILEDDVAWEQYEKLVDGYFNMRAGINHNENTTLDKIYNISKELPNDENKNKIILKLLESIDNSKELPRSDEHIRMNNLLNEFLQDETVILRRYPNKIAVKKELLYEFFKPYGYTKVKLLRHLDTLGFIIPKSKDNRTNKIQLNHKEIAVVILKGLEN